MSSHPLLNSSPDPLWCKQAFSLISRGFFEADSTRQAGGGTLEFQNGYAQLEQILEGNAGVRSAQYPHRAISARISSTLLL